MNTLVFPSKSAPLLGSEIMQIKRGCVISLFSWLFVRSTFPFFCISGKLWGCWVSKPSIPSLVGQIVRQHDLQCPFLVISGGNECYHNPLSHSFSSLSLSLSVPCQPSEKPLCSPAWTFYSCSIAWPINHSLAPLPLNLCQLYLYAFCFDWPFQRLLHCAPAPFSMAWLVVLLWSGTQCGWLDCQGWCARKASAHQKHTGSWGCGASLEAPWLGSWG